MVERLLAAGADVEQRDRVVIDAKSGEKRGGKTLLHEARAEAAEANDIELVELLLSRGADVGARNAAGNNVLHAIASVRERVERPYEALVTRIHALAPRTLMLKLSSLPQPPQLIAQRNLAFFLPADCAAVDSKVYAALYDLQRQQQDADKAAQEAERWAQARQGRCMGRRRGLSTAGLCILAEPVPTKTSCFDSWQAAPTTTALCSDDWRAASALSSFLPAQAERDLSLLGPPTEEQERQQQRVRAMLDHKLRPAVEAIWQEEVQAQRVAAPATPPPTEQAAAAATPREQLRPALRFRRTAKPRWADLADEDPPVVRPLVTPEQLAAEEAELQADPARVLARLLRGGGATRPARQHKLAGRPALGSGPGATGLDGVWLAAAPPAPPAAAAPSVFAVFEVAPEVAAVAGTHREVIRVWALAGTESEARKAAALIEASYQKGFAARRLLVLTPLASAAVAAGAQADRRPADFRGELLPRAEACAAAAAARAAGGALYFPPANTSPDAYTLIRWHKLDDTMCHAVMHFQGSSADELDFPFRLSPDETASPRRRATAVLGGGHPTHVFITASATLKEQVQKAFARLRAAVPGAAARAAAGGGRALHSYRGVPEDAWPLFLTSRQHLQMLYATLDEPFFHRNPDGSLCFESEAQDDDGMSILVELHREAEEGAASNADVAASSAGAGSGAGAGSAVHGGGTPCASRAAGGGTAGGRKLMCFETFRTSVYPRLFIHLTQEQWARAYELSAGLVWQEFVSFIRSSKQALESPTGRLSEEQYLELGRRQAPSFADTSRRIVHALFQEYEAYKRTLASKGSSYYDSADVLHSAYRRVAHGGHSATLKRGGYRGTPIHELYRDEVQDFMQAELLLDLCVVSDPNGLFLFTNVKTLFYAAQRARAEEGRRAGAASEPVAMPQARVSVLDTNYQTHRRACCQSLGKRGSPLLLPEPEGCPARRRRAAPGTGVLDVAATIVAVLKRFFADHIDSLVGPEQAHLEAPHLPLLLPAVTPGNMAMLLSGGDASEAWKARRCWKYIIIINSLMCCYTEFGANQAVLVRSLSSAVPHFLRKVDAIVMTVPQAKGLEFNDVFILDFFAHSPAKEEWRVLLQARAGPRAGPASALRHPHNAVYLEERMAGIGGPAPDPAALGLEGARLDPLGMDLHELRLSKAKRGEAMLRNGAFGPAATCYRKAGHATRAAAYEAMQLLQDAREEEASAAGQQEAAGSQRGRYWSAGYLLLGTAVNARADEASPAERREWLAAAAAALVRAGEAAAAAEVEAALGRLA
eukprot:scaffold7.g3743.t1